MVPVSTAELLMPIANLSNLAPSVPGGTQRLAAIHYLILAGVALFIFTAMRALLTPEAASLRFGLPLLNASDGGFVQVYGLRNLVLALTIGGLVFAHQLGILRILFTGLLLVPIGDVMIIAAHHGWASIPSLHYFIEAYFLIVSGWLWGLRK